MKAPLSWLPAQNAGFRRSSASPCKRGGKMKPMLFQDEEDVDDEDWEDEEGDEGDEDGGWGGGGDEE